MHFCEDHPFGFHTGGSSRFSLTVSVAKMARSSGTYASLLRAIWWLSSRVMSSPRSLIVPVFLRRTPMIERSVVVFPAPFRPMSAMHSPSFTVSETPCSACAWPYQAFKSFTSRSGALKRGPLRRGRPR